MTGVTPPGRALGADGIVGVSFDQHARGHRVKRSAASSART